MANIPDAPWIGLCEEDDEDKYHWYDEGYEDYLAEESERRWEAEQEDALWGS